MTSMYNSHAHYEGGWWIVQNDELPGAISQVATLAQAESAQLEAIAFVAGVTADSADITVTVRIDLGTHGDWTEAAALGTGGNFPYRVSELYSRGEISREQLIEALTAWRYLPGETKTTGLHDDLLNYVPGSFDDIEAASLDDLIDDEIYAIALGAHSAQIRKARADNA